MNAPISLIRGKTRGRRPRLQGKGSQMTRSTQIAFAMGLLVILAGVALAGGWAIITLNEFPDYAVEGKPLNLTFSVRQHGVTLLPGLQPKIQATTSSGLQAKAGVKPTSNRGEYTRSRPLPQRGEW